MNKNLSIYLNILVLISVLTTLFLFPTDVKAALVISVVIPDTISNDQANAITISGNDFVNGAIVSLDGYGSLDTSFFSSTTLFATTPADIPIGTYTLTVSNPDQSTASLANALTVIPTAPTATPSLTPYPPYPPPTIILTPAPTAILTPTSQPPNGYERPVVVVDTYSLSQDTISPGDSFTLFITLYNAGQQYATNVVAIFTPGELMPRETGGVVAVGEIAPSNHSEFGQPLLLSTDVWGPVTSINMLVTYSDETGTIFNETFTITLPVFHSYSSGATSTPTPTQSPTPSIKPQLVITGYTTDVTPLQPGAQFNLTINVQNMGNSTAKSVTMIVGGGSSSSSGDGGTQQPGGISGASGEFTNFAPISSSNVQSLGDFSPGDSISAYQPLIVNVSTTPGAYPLKISFVYIDDQNHIFIDDQVITLLIYRLPLLEISFYQEVSTFYTGQPNMLPLQVVNLGRNSIVLGNMRVNGLGGQFINNSILIGTLDPGGYFTLDASYIPDLPGAVDLVVSIDYTNDFNQSQVITKTLSVEVMEQPFIEPSTNGSQNGSIDVPSFSSETLLQKILRFILGLLGLDSGLNTGQPSNYQPVETVSPEQPIIIPVQPPLKGP
jgi:hypothetical protein